MLYMIVYTAYAIIVASTVGSRMITVSYSIASIIFDRRQSSLVGNVSCGVENHSIRKSCNSMEGISQHCFCAAIAYELLVKSLCILRVVGLLCIDLRDIGRRSVQLHSWIEGLRYHYAAVSTKRQKIGQ